MQEQTGVEQLAGHSDARLCLYLLGPPKIVRNSIRLSVSRHQVRLLLYYLAACDQPVSYEHLRYLFWPDTTDMFSQRRLSRLLNHLATCVNEPRILLRYEAHVQLDRRQHWSDIRTFLALCALQDPGAHHENQQRAVELYRGPFLEGVQLNSNAEFENMIEGMRAGLEQKYLNALAILIEYQTAAGNLEWAIDLCRNYLQINDLNENVHRQLIQLYARSGKRELALKQFNTCAQILQTDLGIKPMLETQSLYQAVLDGRFEKLVNYSANPSPILIPVSNLPFLGRTEILERFSDAVMRASQGQGGVFLINGAGGEGKTRLLQEFDQQVREQSLSLMVGCHPGAQSIPYHPILKILRYITNLDPELVPVDEGLLAETYRLLTDIRDQPDQITAEGNDSRKIAMFHLYESITNIFLQLASRSILLVIIIDDLHHADPSTLDWLSYYASHIEDEGSLLVGTYCCKEEGALAKFRCQLLNLGDGFQEFHLYGLAPQAVYQAVKTTFGSVIGCQRLAARLSEITAGNPLYLQEILGGIVQSGYLPQDLIGKDQWPLPENVWKAVEIRLGRLQPVSRKILENAAYLEPVFYFDQVACLLDITEMELLETLEDLVCRGILIDCDPGYRFQHQLIQLALRRNASKNRQAVLEKRIQRNLNSS